MYFIETLHNIAITLQDIPPVFQKTLRYTISNPEVTLERMTNAVAAYQIYFGNLTGEIHQKFKEYIEKNFTVEKFDKEVNRRTQ